MRGKGLFLINKTVVAILTALMLLTLLVSCKGEGEKLFGYMNEPFFMEIGGEIDGVAFEARVYCDPTEHLTKEIFEKMIISFSSPKELDGITVSLLSSGKCITRLGSIVSSEYVSENICDIFEMFSPEKEMTRIKKEVDKTVVEFEDEKGITVYIFDENNRPVRIEGERKGRFLGFDIKTVKN